MKKTISNIFVMTLVLTLFLVANVMAVAWDPNLNTNLEAYYTFDETTGTTASDSVAGVNDISMVNTTNSNWITGKLGNAISFNGLDEYGIGTDLDLTQNWTINLWVNITDSSPSDENGIIVKRNQTSGFSDYMFFVSSVPPNNVQSFDGFAGRDYGYSLTAQTYTMLTFVFNGTSVLPYKNGVLQTPTSFVSTQNDFPFVIGLAKPQTLEEFWNGSFDELGIWSKALNSTDIANTLYNGGAGNTFVPDVGITLNSPSSGESLLPTNITFNSSLNTSSGQLQNASLYINGIFNQSQNITGTLNESIFIIPEMSLGNYNWTIISCNNLSRCTTSEIRSFTISNYIITSILFNNSTFPGQEENFTLNLVLDPSSSISGALLNYNGTNYTSSIVSINSNITLFNSITIPEVSSQSDINFSFFINIDSTVVQTQNYTQQVTPISMTNCSGGGTVILNMSLFEERLKSTLIGDIEINAQTISKINLVTAGSTNLSFNNVSNGLVCLDPNSSLSDLYLDAEIRYTSDGYAKEFYYIQRTDLANYPIELNLFALDLNESTEITLTYQDSDLIFVSDAIIQLQRKYISEDLYEVVEAPLTSSNGNAIVHVDLNTNKYRVSVVKDGEVLDFFDNVVFSCENPLSGQCTESLFGEIDPQNQVSVEDLLDFSYTVTQTNTTVNTLFSIPSGAPSSVNVLLTQIDQFNNSYVCNNTVFSSAGSVSCTLTPVIGESFVYLSISKDAAPQAIASYIVQEDMRIYFLGNNYFILFILLLSLVGMAFSSPEWIIVNAIITLFLAGALFLARGLNFVVGLGTMTWLLVAAVILIIKIAKQEDR